ncbi:MAG: hemolysin family protein [Desulfobacteraceae bacterium]|nr:hemolysin family protein [Pseudomonadota bacterium]MBU4463466.1 hemolysin family protein [Pseudomonadota bacterium]MCG2755492.1 hemolysin family protein [Desulfobacteraceae bacterium]
MISLDIIIIALCVLIQAFFSGSEMMLIASNKLKLRQEIAKGTKGARLALNMINNQQWFLATTSTGTNMFVIISSVIAATYFHHFFGIYGEPLTIIIMSPVLLMFGEIIPRTLFQQNATEIAPRIAKTLWIASRIISPVTYLVFQASRLFYGRSGREAFKKQHLITRKDLALMLRVSDKESDLQKKEKKLIHRVFHLAESDVADVMVPLVNVTAIPDTTTVEDAIKIIGRTGYSKLPVFKDRIDNLTGVIFDRDILDVPDTLANIGQFIRKAVFVPELKRADDLLISFQKTRDSIAIVVDEYGGSVGIITLEDILEEVVEEIRDEYDSETGQFVRLGKNRFLVNAAMEIEHANEKMNLNLPKEDYETIGGFLLKQMGKIPKKGEILIYRNIKFTVGLSDKKSIHEVIVDIL